MIEQAVSDIGIVKNVSSVYKMNNLLFSKSLDLHVDEIMKKLNEIRTKTSIEYSQYFIEPVINVFYDV
jgi:hypothetical protein